MKASALKIMLVCLFYFAFNVFSPAQRAESNKESILSGEHDVFISEVMADPNPQVSLPNLEYIELYNNSGSKTDLYRWTLVVGNDRKILPRMILPADSFLLITSSGGCRQFTRNNYCLEVLSQSMVNNTGEYVGLKNSSGELIHWMEYDESYYRDDLKTEGGWSLELIDPRNPCAGKSNWMASNDVSGGTPGRKNSVNGTVIERPKFQCENIFLPSDSIVRVTFSNPVRTEKLPQSMFQLSPGSGMSVSVRIDSLRHMYVDVVCFSDFREGITYTLHLSDEISDCAGNNLEGQTEFLFQKPSEPVKGDILLNEILFNAQPEHQEFIELYNHSHKYLCSDHLKLTYRSRDGVYDKTFPLGDAPFLIAPNSFVVLLKAKDKFSDQYTVPDERCLVPTKSFPALSNEEGCIGVMNRNLVFLDEFCYSQEMHFPLVVNPSGVSLERISYQGRTADAANWHSAGMGEATPGAQNSQFVGNDLEGKEEITIDDEIFSPDNDGYKDLETFRYKFALPGFIADVIIYDVMGRRIRRLLNNQLLGASGSFTWDGVDDQGQVVATGIYLVCINLRHPSGDTRQLKKTCTVGFNLRQ